MTEEEPQPPEQQQELPAEQAAENVVWAVCQGGSAWHKDVVLCSVTPCDVVYIYMYTYPGM